MNKRTNKRKTQKKRKGGASLSSQSLSSQGPPSISESEKLELLKRENLHNPIGTIKRQLDKLKEDLNAIPDLGKRIVDAKVEYDKSITTPTNVEKKDKDYKTPKEKLESLHSRNITYKKHVLECAGLSQTMSNSLYKLVSYHLSPKELYIPL